jgi:molybdate transport system substrate-binding protein
MMSRKRLVICAILVLTAVAAHAGWWSRSTPTKTNLTVLAASSLTEAFDDLSSRFQRIYATTQIRSSFAGTQELRVQVQHGAYCDVFASASKDDMDALVKAGLVKNPKVLAYNRLCLIAYPNQGKVAHLSDLSKPGVKLVVGVPTSPIGKYTVQTMEKMAADADYGSAFVSKVKANVVSEETNVKLVLTKVKLGEADAGFVYASDAKGQNVKVITLPQDIRVRATYLIGLGARSKQVAWAQYLINYLLGPSGTGVLKAHVFEPAR